MSKIPAASAPRAGAEAVAVIRSGPPRCRFVFASPHSGSRYPAEFIEQSVLPLRMLRCSEDAHIDTLFDGVPALGAPLVKALFPRSFIDPNRAEQELDPILFGPQAQIGRAHV